MQEKRKKGIDRRCTYEHQHLVSSVKTLGAEAKGSYSYSIRSCYRGFAVANRLVMSRSMPFD